MSNRSKQKIIERPSSQRKLTKILMAAEEEFLTNGFSSSSIEAIAGRALVSKVTIYNHFGDKKNLFAEVLNSQLGHMKSHFEVSRLEENSLREILLEATKDMITFLTQPKMIRFERMLSAEVNRDPDIGAMYLDAGPKSVESHISNLLSESIKRGEIYSDNLSVSIEMLAGLSMGRVDILLRYGAQIELTEKDINDRAQRAVDAWLKIHST